MCGRFALNATNKDIQQTLFVRPINGVKPCYNIAPGDNILALRNHSTKVARELVSIRWGLVPSWMKSPIKDHFLINARVESLNEKPSFRTAYQKRRCLIPASGFFEWKTHLGYKQPFYIYLKNYKIFTFAGIWERWMSLDAEPLESVAIITTEACASLRKIHDRMPLVINDEYRDVWLSGILDGANATKTLKNLQFSFHPVSQAVNNVKNNFPKVIEEIKIKAFRDE